MLVLQNSSRPVPVQFGFSHAVVDGGSLSTVVGVDELLELLTVEAVVLAVVALVVAVAFLVVAFDPPPPERRAVVTVRRRSEDPEPELPAAVNASSGSGSARMVVVVLLVDVDEVLSDVVVDRRALRPTSLLSSPPWPMTTPATTPRPTARITPQMVLRMSATGYSEPLAP